jgi:UDP-N-acetylglucosamine transferase subunit ALG13
MILVTTGTNGVPFDRLLGQLDEIEWHEPLVVQHGPSRLRPAGARCVEYVSFAELVELVREARVVVTHGGVGSILVALMNSKRPVVVPRLARFGEVVDDHQLDLARRMDGADLVTLVEDVTNLGAAVLGTASSAPQTNGHRSTGLVDDLGSYLVGLTADERGTR